MSSIPWQHVCAALIPCLNEAANIGQVVQGVRQHLNRILVIDDGSTDGTSATAREAGAEVLHHPLSRGKGAALRAGLAWAKDNNFSWVLTMDGDGQHAPADIPKFFEAAENSSAGVVIGNRMTAARRIPRVRRWVNRWMSRRLSRRAGREFPDTQCGFRLIKVEAWNNLQLQTEHFEVESEMLMEFVRTGQGIAFVPIEVIYKSEQSKIHPMRDTIRWFRWFASLRRK